jgi:hypothetical protein
MSLIVKPPFGTPVRAGHPLALGLVSAWVLNEGTGPEARDGASGLTLDVSRASWSSGPRGGALVFDDAANDYASVEKPAVTGHPFSVVAAFRRDDTGVPGCVWFLTRFNYENYWFALRFDTGGNAYASTRGGSGEAKATSPRLVQDTDWHEIAGVWRATNARVCYVNGGGPGTSTANTDGFGVVLTRTAIGRYMDATPELPLSGEIGWVYVWGRALSAEEVAWVSAEPFCFLGGGAGAAILAPGGPTIREVSGSAGAASSAGAAGTVSHASERPTGASWPAVTLQTETPWQREVLLNGLTDTGYRLGTVLTQGWFWALRAGCTAVYRSGDGDPHHAEFGSPAAVGEIADNVIRIPHVDLGPDATCCYVARRFNGCGRQDRTLGAAALVHTGPDGQLAPPAANPVLWLQAQRASGGRVRLAWFYSPLDQRVTPQAFQVYWDNRTGEIDFGSPLATVAYEGHGLYEHRTGALEEGRYLFAVRAQSAVGEEGPVLQIRLQKSNLKNRDAPVVVRAEIKNQT